MPLRLYSALETIYYRVQNKLDGCIIITGKVGSGKTNVAKGISGTWQDFFKNQFELKNIFFDAIEVVKFTDDETTETEAILYDEAIQGASGRDVITKAGNLLKVTMITKRRKKHLYIFIVDEIKELSKKIISRCNLLIDVDYKKVSQEKYIKGLFKMYSGAEAKDMFNLMKKGVIGTIKDYRPKKKKRIMYAKLYEDIWFEEREYDKKKIKETALITEKENDKQNKLMQQRNTAVIALLDNGVTQQKVANLLGLSRSSIQDIKNKMMTTGGVNI